MPEKDSRSERELVAAARAGDRSAVDALVARHQARIYRYGMKMCGDPEEAREIAQETLLTLARSVRTFRGDASLSTWLFQVARSHCIKRRRRSKYAPARVESLDTDVDDSASLPDPSAASPEDVVAARELGAAIERAIAALDPPYREVLVLRDVEGLSAREVATVLEVSVPAVKSRLHRARAFVREQLQPLVAQAPDTAAACPDVVALLSKHLEGDVAPALCAQMEAHVDRCAACRARCDALRAALAACRQCGQAPVPPRVERAVRAAVAALAGASPP